MFFSGKRLKAARKFKFKTMDGLVNSLDQMAGIKVNRGMISRWENDKATPREETIFALASCLEVTPDYLMENSGLGNELIYLRFLNKMSIDEVVQKSGVSRESIVLAEGGINPLKERELQAIGEIYGIKSLRQYLMQDANILEPVSQEDAEFIMDSLRDISENYQEKHTDLHSLLESESLLSYKKQPLSRSQRKKISRIIEALLETEETDE